MIRPRGKKITDKALSDVTKRNIARITDSDRTNNRLATRQQRTNKLRCLAPTKKDVWKRRRQCLLELKSWHPGRERGHDTEVPSLRLRGILKNLMLVSIFTVTFRHIRGWCCQRYFWPPFLPHFQKTRGTHFYCRMTGVFPTGFEQPTYTMTD